MRDKSTVVSSDTPGLWDDIAIVSDDRPLVRDDSAIVSLLLAPPDPGRASEVTIEVEAWTLARRTKTQDGDAPQRRSGRSKKPAVLLSMGLLPRLAVEVSAWRS